jgi:hypothetical protein
MLLKLCAKFKRSSALHRTLQMGMQHITCLIPCSVNLIIQTSMSTSYIIQINPGYHIVHYPLMSSDIGLIIECKCPIIYRDSYYKRAVYYTNYTF